MIQRRTFLKVASSTVGAMVVHKYAEPFEVLPENDWITDRGDFYIVRVPDFKTFKNELLNKPTIFILGQSAVVSGCEVIGFANIAAPKGGTFDSCKVDSSAMEVPRKRSIIEIREDGLVLTGNHVIGRQFTDSGIFFESNHHMNPLLKHIFTA